MKRQGYLRAWLTKESVHLFAPAVLLTVLAFVLAFHFIKPAPPTHLVIATGRTDGAYYQFGLRYRDLLAREGITLEVDGE